MNKPITINQLKNFCNSEIRKGHGDYAIMISEDDEGNGYHYLWYAFTPIEEYGNDEFGVLCNLDERVAPKDKTIILG